MNWNGTDDTRTEVRILNDLVAILEDMIADWDMELDGGLGPDTRLVADLSFESIDIVQFIVAIEERFRCKGLPFEEFLMTDGRYVDEIRVRDAVTFLYRHLNTRSGEDPGCPFMPFEKRAEGGTEDE